jgi:hypothetical protein
VKGNTKRKEANIKRNIERTYQVTGPTELFFVDLDGRFIVGGHGGGSAEMKV